MFDISFGFVTPKVTLKHNDLSISFGHFINSGFILDQFRYPDFMTWRHTDRHTDLVIFEQGIEEDIRS